MCMMYSKEIRERLKDIDEFLLAEYKLEKGEEKRDWRTYEEQYLQRIKEAVRQLKPSVDGAVAGVEEYSGIDFVRNTKEYLGQYYKRENSECGWSMDKRRFGWEIAQRLPCRIDAADFCTAIWHNLFQLGAG